MKESKPPKNTRCPMCGNVPDPEEFARDSEPFVWNGMMQMHICSFCNMELAIEFYEEESSYFTKASRLLGKDIWECKKRYLEDVVHRSESILAKESRKQVIADLQSRIEKCKMQMAAIEGFLAARRGNDHEQLASVQEALNEALSIPAFGVEIALPNLIKVSFE